MPKPYRGVMLLVLAAGVMRADLKVTVRTSVPGQEPHVATTYYKGDWMRSDHGVYSQIIDFSTGRSINIDTAKKEYHVFEGRSGPKQVVDSTQKMFVDISTSDTGEERQMLGHTARRYVTVKKTRMETEGRPPTVSETKFEGWYIDVPAPPHAWGIRDDAAAITTLGFGTGGEMKVPEVKVTRDGPRPQGMIVWEKTERYEIEVVELSDAPIEQSVFDPPKGFRKMAGGQLGYVTRPLSWSDELAIQWLRVREWVASLFS